MLTLAEAKLQLNIDPSNTTNDVELQSFVDAAIGAVERHTGLVGTVRTVTDEKHTACFADKLWLDNKPVQSITSVTRVDVTQTWSVANLSVDVDTGVIRVLTGPLLTGLLKITYQAGYTIVPPNMNLAARIIVQHLWQTQRGPGTGSARFAGDEPESSFTAGNVFSIPHRALELLGEQPPVIS